MKKALWYLVFPALGLALAASVGWFVWVDPPLRGAREPLRTADRMVTGAPPPRAGAHARGGVLALSIYMLYFQ